MVMLELPFVKQIFDRLEETQVLMQFVIGPRQVGKTTGIEQLIKKYHKGLVHYQLAEGELNPDPDWLRLQWQKAISLGDNALLVIDEIKKVEQWSEKLKSLWDQSKKNKTYLKCIFLGSSSLNLQRGMSESLSGRFEVIKVMHWDYSKSLKINPRLSFDDYLKK